MRVTGLSARMREDSSRRLPERAGPFLFPEALEWPGCIVSYKGIYRGK